MTAATIGKVLGMAAVTASAALGAFKAGRAVSAEGPQTVAQQANSAPAITSADIAAVRDELRSIQRDSNHRFEVLDQRLSYLEGYVARGTAK